jgi:hypothetical protein
LVVQEPGDHADMEISQGQVQAAERVGRRGLWAKHGMIQQRGRLRPVCSCVVKTRENLGFVEFQRLFGVDLCLAVLELHTH